MKTKAILASCILLLSACSSGAPTQLSSVPLSPAPPSPAATDTASVIEREAADFLASSKAHAVSLAVTYRGKGYTVHQGNLHAGKVSPPDRDTFYEVASITKTFTGTIAAQAVLDGKIGLDDDIRPFLEGDYPNLAFEGAPIQFRHLLTHTSGLPANSKGMEELLNQPDGGDATGGNWRAIYAANLAETRESFLAYLDEVELDAVPGTIFNYSNYGTNLTAHILERVYGETYAQLLDRFVFEPADMHEASLQLSPKEKERFGLGYNQAGEAIPRLPIADVLWGADGAVKATSRDMLHYMQWQLEGETLAIDESHRRLDRRDTGYWLGYFWWVIDTETGARSYRHDGGGAGVRNVMILYPEDELAIYAVTNKTTREMNGKLTSLVRNIRRKLIEPQD